MLRLRLRLSQLLLLLAVAGSPAVQAADTESLLRQQLQQALWPAEIVRLADQYLSRFPDGPATAEASTALAQAQQAQRVLSRNDVRLYRSAFQPAGDSRVQDELRRAALADREAAVRIAHWHQRGEQGVANDQNRYVGWLQYAAMLGDQRASYELALHYRRDAQPVLAAQYEARAVELGFTPPRDLDHVRK